MLSTIDLTSLILLGVKILVAITFGAYLLFSIIFLGKIRLLSKIIETKVSPWISWAALINAVVTAVFLLISIVI